MALNSHVAFWGWALCSVGFCIDEDLARGSSLLPDMSLYSVWFDSVSSDTDRAVWPSPSRTCCLPPSFG